MNLNVISKNYTGAAQTVVVVLVLLLLFCCRGCSVVTTAFALRICILICACSISIIRCLPLCPA